MKIKSLTLHGFKSFADRTAIDFHGGITAIVGPNGCGKSNISDALRWVLGEQRPTAIRGSRMEEAIFQGTAQRRPIHRAEVALSLTNEDGILPVPYSEVVIGRTVLRGGESIYTLNGNACRLRDIQDLCRDTGLGANAYSIIEGRMVDAILSDRAEERRSLFEEAAEVGRYKDRRRTALRRLDQAEQDLKRLEDVLGEVRSKVRALGRQRGKARRYAELRELRLQLEVAVAGARLRVLESQLGVAEEDLAGRQQRRPELETALQSQETAAETLRLEILEREQERSRVATRLEAVRTRLEELERDRLVTSERVSSAERRIQAIHAERNALEQRRGELRGELEEVASNLASVEEGAKGLSERVGLAEAEVEAARARRQACEEAEQAGLARLAEVIQELGSRRAEGEVRRERARARRAELDARAAERAEAVRTVEELETAVAEAASALDAVTSEREGVQAALETARDREREAREQLQRLRDGLATLDGELTSLEARRGGLAAMLSSGRDLPPAVAAVTSELGESHGVLGVLASYLAVPRERTAAVEACLGSLACAVVVRDWDAVQTVRTWLAGRADDEGLVLLPVDPGPRVPSPKKGSLLDGVELQGAGADWARALLADVAANENGTFGPEEGAWVSADGSGQDRLGIVRLGQPAGGKGLLRRRAELEELAARFDELVPERSKLEAEVAHRSDELRPLAVERGDLESAMEAAVESHRRALSLHAAAEEKLVRARRALSEVAARVEEMERSLVDGDTAADDGAELAVLKERRAAAEAALAEERAGTVAVTAEWERDHEALQELRLRLAREEAGLLAAQDRRRRAEDALRELEERASRLEEDLSVQHGAVETGRARMQGSEEALGGLLEERRELQEDVRTRQEHLDRCREDLEGRESELRVARQADRSESEARHALELQIAQLRGQRATVRERLEAEWEASFEELEARVTRPEEGDLASWEGQLERVRTSLAGIGPVNLLAAQEYDEESERLGFLEDQRADLESARQDLHDSIRRINEAASASFTLVFEQVRENFHRIFDTLFEGGECDVWLEDPEDPLDSPIEISASPRGKRTQRIHLLSGGERALTALALLFAIYLAKPSPFCVMDEVDAPLDESNIGRFTTMLEKFKSETQFIVITHNARTIEAADWIYGVTMQEPGVSSLVGVELQDLPRGQVA